MSGYIEVSPYKFKLKVEIRTQSDMVRIHTKHTIDALSTLKKGEYRKMNIGGRHVFFLRQ